MEKFKIIALAIILVCATVFVSGCIGEDDFSKNMKEAGASDSEEAILSKDLEESLNDQSKKGIEKKINLTNQLIPLIEKIDVSFNKALNSTDNETIKEYLKLAIELNQLDLNELKNQQVLFKADQDYNNEKISASEYDKLYNTYEKNYDNYIKNIEKTTKKIKNLLNDNPDFVEELKSYGFGGGLFLGEYRVGYSSF